MSVMSSRVIVTKLLFIRLISLSYKGKTMSACCRLSISSELGTAFLAHNRGCKTIFE